MPIAYCIDHERRLVMAEGYGTLFPTLLCYRTLLVLDTRHGDVSEQLLPEAGLYPC
jgi:hypothetical protein